VKKILGNRSAAFTLTVYGRIFDTDLDLVAENLDQAGVVGAAFVPRRGSKRLGSNWKASHPRRRQLRYRGTPASPPMGKTRKLRRISSGAPARSLSIPAPLREVRPPLVVDRTPRRGPTWAQFLSSQAAGILACDW
jgi:hypothetical protein